MAIAILENQKKASQSRILLTKDTGINYMTKLPKNNVVYYPPGTRVLWRGHPGVIYAYQVKPYAYPVGYDVQLDARSGGHDITNSGYGELELEATGKPAQSGRPIAIPDEAMRYTS